MGGRIFWLVLPLLGLALLAGGVWLALQGQAAPPARPAERGSVAEEPAPASEELAPEGAREVVRPADAEVAPPARAEEPAAAVPAATAVAAEDREPERRYEPAPAAAPRASVLSGTLRWPEGAPAQAVLQLVPLAEGAGEPLETTHSDEDGHFEFTWTGAAEVEVVAEAERPLRTPHGVLEPARFRARSGPLARDGRALELVLAPGQVLAGTLQSRDGRPLAGSVFARLLGDHEAPRTGVADERGEFALLGLGPGRWSVRAHADGYLSEAREVELPTDTPLAFVLATGAGLLGRIEDELGRPVAGATVVALALEGQGARAKSEEDGSFALRGLTPGTQLVLAARPGQTAQARTEVTLAAEELRTGLVLVLAEAGGLGVVASDARGRRLAGLELMLVQEGRTHATGTTGAAGEVELAGLRPGEYELVLVQEDGVQLRERVVVRADETRRVELVTPVVPVRVRAAVRIARRAAGGLVLEAHRADTRALVAEARTADDGTCVLELAEPGEHWFVVRDSARGLAEWRRVRVPDGPGFAFELELELGQLAGTVWSHDGERLAGIELFALAAGEDGSTRSSGTTRSDENGEFLLELVPGTYLLEAREVVGEGAQGEFAPTRLPGVLVRARQYTGGLEMTLEPGARLEGRVRRRDGTGVFGAHLWLAEPGSSERPRLLGESGALGRFRLENLPHGTWLVTASEGGRQARWREVEIGSATVAELELVLE